MKVFIETSIFIRFFTEDDPKKAKDCTALFELIESGNLQSYSSNVVIMEVLYVLSKIYKFPKKQVLKDLRTVLNLRNLTFIEKTNTMKALEVFEKFSIKFGDCLIATQIPEKLKIVTYDTDFKKIKGLDSVTPAEII